MIGQQGEMVALAIAEGYMKQGNYLEAIEVLKPHYHSKDKKHNLLVVRLLAHAYMHSVREIPQAKTFALPLWEILLQSAMSQSKPDYKDAVSVMLSLMVCINDQYQAREDMTQKALKIMKNHANAFLILDDRRKVSNSYLINMRYTVCLSAAISNAYNGSMQTDVALQIKFFQQARKYFAAALEHKPGDLAALLHFAKFMIVESRQNVQLALDLLLPHATKYKRSPSYNSAMKKLYLMINAAEHSDEYGKRFSASRQFEANEAKAGLMTIFHDPRIPEISVNNSPVERLQIVRSKCSQQKFNEAKEILRALLVDFPGYTKALEVLATLESFTVEGGRPEEASILCDRILALNPQSITALLVKADFFAITAKTDDEAVQAYLLYEKAFEYGCREISILDKLIAFNLEACNNEKVIQFSLEKVSREPCILTYYFLGSAYYRLDQYDKALEIFYKVRTLDKYFERDLVSFYILCSLFHLAMTMKDYNICAKKLSSYLSRIQSYEDNPIIDMMLKHFEQLGIPVYHAPHLSQPLEETVEASESYVSLESKSNTRDQDLLVPSYVKVKIKEWMNSSVHHDRSISDYDPVPELEEKEITYYQIGGPEAYLEGYIAKQDKIPPELLAQFKKVLASDCRFLSIKGKTKEGSNKLGVEKLDDERLAVKIDSDYRLVSTGKFFKKRVDDETKYKTIVRFEKVKTHSRLNR